MALGIGSIISGGLSLLGGLASSDASQQAAQTQAQSGQAAIAEQQREFDIGQAALKPYQQFGQSALYSLGDYLGLTGLSPGGSASIMSGAATGGGGQLSLDQIKAQLAPQFTTGGGSQQVWNPFGAEGGTWSTTPTGGTVDQAALDAAAQKQFAAQQAQTPSVGGAGAPGAKPTGDLVNQLYQQYLGRPATADEVSQTLSWAQDPHSLETAIAQATGKTPTYQISSAAPGPNTGSLLKPFSFDISQDPGYQFRLDQGNMGVENSAAAAGTQLSGATLKELLKYGSDYASGEYNAAFARDQTTKNQIYSMLSGAAGMGQGATNTAVQAGQTAASNIGNTLTGIGNATAAGQVGSGNALSNALSGAGSTVNQAMLLKNILGNTNQGVNAVNSGVDLTQYAAG